jgi:hypothetical protein
LLGFWLGRLGLFLFIGRNEYKASQVS